MQVMVEKSCGHHGCARCGDIGWHSEFAFAWFGDCTLEMGALVA